MRTLLLTFCFLALQGIFLPAQAQDEAPANSDRDAIYAKANELYESGDHEGARDLYRQLAEAGNLSADLFFNLGNAEFRADNIGAAGLWYRRALELNPGMTEAAQNLRLIRQEQGFQTFDEGQLDGLAGRLTPEQWRVVMTISMWVLILSGITLVTFRKRMVQAVFWPVIVLSLTCLAISGTGVIVYLTSANPEQIAVILEPEADAVTGPFPEAKSVISLPAGSEVRIRGNRDAWTLIETPGKTAGWIRTSFIAPVKNW